MQYNFLYDLAMLFCRFDQFNITSLYMLKYNLGQLVDLRKRLVMKENVINHPKWAIFLDSSDYMGFLKMIDQMVQTN